MDTRDYVEACDQDLAQRKSDVQQKLTLVYVWCLGNGLANE